MTAAAKGEKDPVIVIHADAQATHQSVVHEMDAARLSGYARITFATQSRG
jgi:biopolymer transport protein ExbD